MVESVDLIEMYHRVSQHPYLNNRKKSLFNISGDTFEQRYGKSLCFEEEWLLLTGKRGGKFEYYLFQLVNIPEVFGAGTHTVRLYLPTVNEVVVLTTPNLSKLKRDLELEDFLPPRRCCYVVRGYDLYRIGPLLPLFYRERGRKLHQTHIENFFFKQFSGHDAIIWNTPSFS